MGLPVERRGAQVLALEARADRSENKRPCIDRTTEDRDGNHEMNHAQRAKHGSLAVHICAYLTRFLAYLAT